MKPFSSQLGTTVAWQLFQFKWEDTAQLYSALFGRLRRLTALRRFRAAQQLSNYSTLVSFQISKIFLISVAIPDPESGPMCIFPLVALIKRSSRYPRSSGIFGPRGLPLHCCCCCCIVSPSLRSRGLSLHKPTAHCVFCVALVRWCFLRLRSQRDVAFLADVTRHAASHATQPASSPTDAN